MKVIEVLCSPVEQERCNEELGDSSSSLDGK